MPVELGRALSGDLDGSGLWATSNPALAQHRLEESGTERAGEMVASLSPVQAGPSGVSFAGDGCGDVDAEPVEELGAGVGECELAVVDIEVVSGREVLVDVDGQFTGKVVVAAAGGGELGGDP